MSQSQPLVSIITVCLNAEDTIVKTVESVINQDYPSIEYIIIDGKSTDRTLEVIEKYSSHISQIISEKDNGISDAFNKGIRKATGDIIGILNADDWYESHTVRLVVEAFMSDERVGVVCGWQQYWNGEEKHALYTSDFKHLTSEMTINHSAAFVKKSVYRDHGLFLCNYRYAMDYELMLRFYVSDVIFVELACILSNMQLGGVSDGGWIKALQESRSAKLTHLSKPLFVNMYFVFQVVRGFLRRLLERVGLRRIVRHYRGVFSLLKKR